MTYRLHPASGVIVIATGEHVQPGAQDEGWQAYRAWVKAGNLPATAEPALVPLAELRDRLRSRINQHRDRLLAAPIAADAARFDADAASREAAADLLQRIARGDGLPAGWAGWRDADNVMRWAALDAAGVALRLRALLRAIGDRRQALLAAGWAKKDEVEALDRAALEAYRPDRVWPGQVDPVETMP